MFGIGAGEFVVIVIVGLIVFGPSKLPELARTIGKALQEFRKAQAAFSATLNEPLDDTKKNSSAENNSTSQSATVTNSTKAEVSNDVVPQNFNDTQKNSATSAESLPAQKKSAEKISSTQPVTADDVINMAKANPIVKETSNEEIFNGNPVDASVSDTRASLAGAGRSSNGTGK